MVREEIFDEIKKKVDESKTKVDKDDKASEVGTDIDEEDFAKDIDTEMGVLPVRDAKASDKDGALY